MKLKNSAEVKNKWVTTPIGMTTKTFLLIAIALGIWMLSLIDYTPQDSITKCLSGPIGISIQSFLPLTIIVFSLFLIADEHVRSRMWGSVFSRAQRWVYLPFTILGFLVLELLGIFSLTESGVCPIVSRMDLIPRMIILTILFTLIAAVSLVLGKAIFGLFKKIRSSEK